MKAVILAAGEGKRMRPLTCTRPKVMLPIANKPILEHLLIEVAWAGIKEFIFVIGYHSEQLRRYFGGGDRWGVKIDYCLQPEQMGTADAIKMVKSKLSGNFLVMNGDVLAGREDIYRLAGCNADTMSVTKVDDAKGLGVVQVSDGRVARIYEKMANPPSRLANAGLYLFTQNIFEAISKTSKSSRGEYEITESLQVMIDSGFNIAYQEVTGWLDVGYPWDLLSANESLLSGTEAQNRGKIEENVVVKGAVVIGENSIVRSGSYLIGPVVIGRNCDIGPNCYIRPATAIGDGCRIGAAVEVKNSIIMKGSRIPHHNYVGDSVIGEDCNLGSGTKIANLKLDKKDVVVAGINTGRRKLGAILGDRVETGINASINVGSLIGNETVIGPGAVASGVIEPNSKVFRRSK